jgi:hypothetical protein
MLGRVFEMARERAEEGTSFCCGRHRVFCEECSVEVAVWVSMLISMSMLVSMFAVLDLYDAK